MYVCWLELSDVSFPNIAIPLCVCVEIVCGSVDTNFLLIEFCNLDSNKQSQGSCFWNELTTNGMVLRTPNLIRCGEHLHELCVYVHIHTQIHGVNSWIILFEFCDFEPY